MQPEKDKIVIGMTDNKKKAPRYESLQYWIKPDS